jgi:hypothetical protein
MRIMERISAQAISGSAGRSSQVPEYASTPFTIPTLSHAQTAQKKK